MFNSTMIDVFFGLVLVYLLLSLMSSAITEWSVRWSRKRAVDLEREIRKLLDGGAPDSRAIAEPVAQAAAGGGEVSFADLFYQHPLIAGLFCDGRAPSYIPGRTFAVALLDTVAPSHPGKAKSFEQLRLALHALPDSKLKRRLLSLVDGDEASLATARAGVERWFDDSMDRLSGVYKRHAHVLLFGIGLLLALLANADTVSMVERLQHDSVLRAVVTSTEQKQVSDAADRDVAVRTAAAVMRAAAAPGSAVATEDAAPSVYQRSEEDLVALDIVGWDRHRGAPRGIPGPNAKWFTWLSWGVLKLLGLALTGIAISIGAPFWFDLLGRLVSLRSPRSRPEREDQRR